MHNNEVVFFLCIQSGIDHVVIYLVTDTFPIDGIYGHNVILFVR